VRTQIKEGIKVVQRAISIPKTPARRGVAGVGAFQPVRKP
jgi:hypothetical protein